MNYLPYFQFTEYEDFYGTNKLPYGGSGCVLVESIVLLTYTYYFKKLISVPTRHYAKIRAILMQRGIESGLLPYAGRALWKEASQLYSDAKLPYWSKLMTHLLLLCKSTKHSQPNSFLAYSRRKTGSKQEGSKQEHYISCSCCLRR